jgi:hypothetical protein
MSLIGFKRWLVRLSCVIACTYFTLVAGGSECLAQKTTPVFGADFPNLDSLAVGEWWKKKPKGANAPPTMLVPRNEVIAFVLYTCQQSTLKLTAQLFPLYPDELRKVRLEVLREGEWREIASSEVVFPGWSAHFRVENWDGSQDWRYRIRHGENASFEGTVRGDLKDKAELVVATMSCNSSRTTGARPEMVDALLEMDPDLLFFAGDQTYRHTEHTAGWIEFGLQFRELMRNRPTVTIPDDHDVGHPNLWGENGKKSTLSGNADGGYFYPVEYVNMVQRQQAWHLPDPVDPAPVERDITVYFTRLKLGAFDFAILEDRKFKSAPAGKIPQMGPRPDHINDPNYDPKSIDLPGLQLLGARQMKFLDDWGNDWEAVEMKAVLSQTAFCGAVHNHGGENDRLLADLDCNGWPQTPRNEALKALRRVWGVHLCGDQHLAVVVQHGIERFRDGPFAFTSPALVNTIYGRWWHPADEKAGPNPIPNSPLPWTGDFLDGLGNPITMIAYANPTNIKDEKQRADGFGIARFNKEKRTITFECWPRFPLAESKQFAGWPITISQAENDGRQVIGVLPKVVSRAGKQPVVQVVDETTGEVVYTVRAQNNAFQPKVYSAGPFTLKAGDIQANQVLGKGLKPEAIETSTRVIEID